MVLAGFLATGTSAHASATDAWWHLDAVNAPTDLRGSAPPVVVAIVDDGVRLTHADVAGLIATNPDEKPGNNVDEDGNGFIDDAVGWDLADNDADPAPPTGNADFYHGTHLAGIIARMARRAFGSAAAERIQLLPVKVLADDAPRGELKHAYAGIDYALTRQADVVLAAWNQAHLADADAAILKRAAAQGVVVVGAAGNEPEELPRYPAAMDSVIGVAATDRQGRLWRLSNYGDFVDLRAPGFDIVGASWRKDDMQQARSGTSYAAAIVAGAAAIVRASNPRLGAAEVRACLLAGSKQPAQADSLYGRRGAGALNIAAAVDCALLTDKRSQQRADNDQQTTATVRTQPKGHLRLQARGGQTLSWQLKHGPLAANAEPVRAKGYRFKPIPRAGKARGTIEFRQQANAEPIATTRLDEFSQMLFVPGDAAHVTYRSKSKRDDALLAFDLEMIDLRTRFCAGTKTLTRPGRLVDGSGDKPYAARSDCKWVIRAPAGQRIRFRFEAFDTESRTDALYFFDGSTTQQDGLMAAFSGNDIPPLLTSWSEQTLVWFVSNGSVEGQGFTGTIEFVPAK
ncbi:MAG: S8 family serine peptidase [Pseudomonadota bacterium]